MCVALSVDVIVCWRIERMKRTATSNVKQINIHFEPYARRKWNNRGHHEINKEIMNEEQHTFSPSLSLSSYFSPANAASAAEATTTTKWTHIFIGKIISNYALRCISKALISHSTKPLSYDWSSLALTFVYFFCVRFLLWSLICNICSLVYLAVALFSARNIFRLDLSYGIHKTQ